MAARLVRIPHSEKLCEWCGQPFIPTADDQRFCRPTHKSRSGHRRRHGKDPVKLPLLNAHCEWCGVKFETQDPLQKCCCRDHKMLVRTCERKEHYLTEDAAAAAASKRTAPGLRMLGYYRCHRQGTLPHWHLFSKDKQNLKKKIARQRKQGQADLAGDSGQTPPLPNTGLTGLHGSGKEPAGPVPSATVSPGPPLSAGPDVRLADAALSNVLRAQRPDNYQVSIYGTRR